MTATRGAASKRPGGRPGRSGGRTRRSVARLAAAQALYQIELGGAAPEDVLREFLEQRLGEEVEGVRLAPADRAMLADLVRGVAARRVELDDMLAAVLDPDWPVERLETLLHAMLRAGVFELAERRDIPARVVISEYLDLADAFFDGKEPAMVNGVLDRVARALRPEEFDARDADPAPG